jgi:hypothetical protein
VRAVVGGLLVRLQADLAGELGWHRGAVGLDVGDVAAREPQPHGDGDQQREQEDDGEGVHWAGNLW